MAIPYRPLNPNRQEIRLLRQSSASTQSGRLEHELIHYTFDQKFGYFALSYVWGTQEPQGKTISVDREIVPVSMNLWAALNSLCNPPRAATKDEDSSSDQWRRFGSIDPFAKAPQTISQNELILDIWVDALCINQSDRQEKSSQITLMPQIYTNSACVLMWLGEEEENTRLAFDLIRDAPNGYPVELVRNGSEKSKHWEALKSLFARPYWSRVWILQEVLHSQGHAIMCCGSCRMHWTRAAIVFSKLTTALCPISTEIPRNVILWTSKLPVSLAATYLQYYRGGKFSFLDYLVLAQSRNCSDARDKVFGILGVCDSESIIVDYSKSVKDIFRDTARYLIQKDQDFDVLSACKHFQMTGFFASQIQEGFEWLRDGSALGQNQFDQLNALVSRHAEILPKMKTAMYPHGHIPSWVPNWSKLVSEDKHLLLRSRERSTFEHRGTQKGQGATLDQFWPVWSREAEHGNPYGDEQAQKMAYKVTLMSGRGPLGDRDDLTPSRPSLDAMLHFGDANLVDLPKASPLGLDGLVQFEQAYYDNFLGSSFLITEEKHMGRGPLEMHKVDQICIFFGGKVPYILRKWHTKWILIGECYVHGIMEGEALMKYAAGCGELKLEQFCLV